MTETDLVTPVAQLAGFYFSSGLALITTVESELVHQTCDTVTLTTESVETTGLREGERSKTNTI